MTIRWAFPGSSRTLFRTWLAPHPDSQIVSSSDDAKHANCGADWDDRTDMLPSLRRQPDPLLLARFDERLVD